MRWSSQIRVEFDTNRKKKYKLTIVNLKLSLSAWLSDFSSSIVCHLSTGIKKKKKTVVEMKQKGGRGRSRMQVRKDSRLKIIPAG